MVRPTRIIILSLISLSLGAVIYKVAETLWLQKVMEFQEDPMMLLDLVPQPALQLKEFRRSKVEDGRKVWELTGDEAVYLKADREAIITSPRLIIYNQNNENVEVRGDQGHIYFNDGEMDRLQLRGGVEIYYQGFVLKTNEIVYHQRTNQVTSKGKVAMKGKGLDLEGVGAVISLKDSRLRLRGKVKTKIRPDMLEKQGITAG
jgi:LPS export ABC transporter protein LptC